MSQDSISVFLKNENDDKKVCTCDRLLAQCYSTIVIVMCDVCCLELQGFFGTVCADFK